MAALQMFAFRSVVFFAPLLLVAQAATLVRQHETGDRTVTEVVKLLQSMMDKSKVDGEAERDLYAKHKCYCDTNTAEKTSEIEELTTDISLLENEIDEIRATNAMLSKDVAKLQADKAANLKARGDAESIMQAQNASYDSLHADLSAAIGSMDEAIQVLADIGADQTLSVANDHKYYMANESSLINLKATVKQALIAASAFVSQKQVTSVESLLQAPFTGVYSAQSGEVIGILKDMRSTFSANLEASMEAQRVAVEAYNKYMATMEASHAAMDREYLKKQSTLGAKDAELGTKKGQLGTAKVDLSEAESFLDNLKGMCAAKKKQYGEREELRTREEAAIAEAIAILNSDAAFATFGTVSATKDSVPSFIQYQAIREHSEEAVSAEIGSRRQKVEAFLQKAAGAHGSPLLRRISALLQANNPFATVLEEIQKMIALIADEEQADTDQKEWCDSERSVTGLAISDKSGEITTLEGQINDLNVMIADPETGLRKQIANTERLLQENHDTQVSETQERKETNLAYQKDISNLVDAEALLSRAIVVLKEYYSKIDARVTAEFVQKHAQEPPATWNDKYKGQSDNGYAAINLLETILTNSQAEEKAAHEDENAAQVLYEDSMASLKSEEAGHESSLVSLKGTLAAKEKELREKDKVLTTTEKEKAALQAYLLKIKPGCDFITDNIVQRQANRAEETRTLNTAVSLLKGTPVYVEAMEAAHNETLGNCLSICTPDELHVDCKACLAETSVPGYCAGHPATLGC